MTNTTDRGPRVPRLRKLVKSRLQLRLVLAFAVVGLLACLFQVTLLGRSLLRLAQELPESGDSVLGLLPGLLAWNLVWTGLFLLPATFLVGVLVTHRVAGPVLRFERWLGEIARGEDPGPCRIRADDELQELCQRLNEAVQTLREERREAGSSSEAA